MKLCWAMCMGRILIDARALTDNKSGGVGRAARYWIKPTCHLERNAVKSKDPDRPIEPDPSTSSDYAQDDRLKVILVTTGWQPSPTVREFCDQNGYQYLHLKIPNKLWTLLCFLKMASLSKSAEKKFGSIDLVLLPNLGFVGNLHRPYQILIHDLSFIIEPHWFTLRRRWWHKLMPVKKLIEGAEKIDCVSKQTKNDVLRIFKLDETKINVIPAMDFGLPDIQSIKPKWLSNSIQRFVLLLGGSDPRKNVYAALRAIEAFNIRHSTSPIIPIVLGGKVKCPLGQCPLAYVKAPDRVNDGELAYLYQNAKAVLYPSWYEGFGLPLHEAHQFKTPVIASTAGALPETAPPEIVFCHPAKPHEWLRALELVLK